MSCWAKNVTVESASTKYAALLEFQIKRRDTLDGMVESPLAEVSGAPERDKPSGEDVTALDLDDVPEDAVTAAVEGKPAKKQPANTVAYKPTAKATDPTVVLSASGEDVSDYI